jgi:PRC-barrel domain
VSVADLPTRRDFEDFAAWAGRDVLGPDGERLGAVDVIFLDEATGTPEWVLVGLDDGSAFVPLAGASVEERAIRVDQAADRIAAAPRPEGGDTLSVAEEKRLYEHYGLEYSQAESSTVLPEGVAPEERPRLRKYVGAPVAAPATEEPATEGPATEEPATEEPATEEPATEEPAAEAASAADRMAPRNLSSATPTELPPRAPEMAPQEAAAPEGGSRSDVEESTGSKRRIAIPIALASAIAGLIAVLAFRRRR